MRYALDKDLLVTAAADVVVVGGGPGGLGAAVMAARAGAKVLLVERHGGLGGMASFGEVHPFMPNHVRIDGTPAVCLDRPVYMDWCRAMHAYLPEAQRLEVEKDGELVGDLARRISKDAAMLAAEDLCREAGVNLLFHHTLADVIREGRRIAGLVLLSKSGFTAVQGRQYVDATGDADVAFRAGCACEQGGPSGHAQPMTTCFKLSGVEVDRMPKWEELTRLFHAAKAAGEIDCPRENVLYFHCLEPDVIHFNTTRVIHRQGTDGADLSAAEIEARTQVRELCRFLQAKVSGFENSRLHSIAQHIGVRETRRVRGLAYLEREAFVNRRKFPDAIARVRYPIDIHNPDGTGTELIHMPEDEWYEIPYGCVVAREVDNLTVGGRPISVDHAIHSSMRVMPSACTVGQAAGLGAALAAQRNVRPADLDGCDIRQRLIALGAHL
jgi:hypothetical protein